MRIMKLNLNWKQALINEKKAFLIRDVIQAYPGLTKSEVETIANWQWQKNQYDEISISVIPEIDIKVHDTVNSFAEAVVLQRTGIEHSWAGEETYKEYGNWIVGGGVFGIFEKIEYSLNGSVSSPVVESLDPEFDQNNNQVVLIKSIDHNSLNRATTIEESWCLHILPGGSIYEIDPAIQSILNLFNM